MSKGHLIIFSAPSGAGKTTIVRALRKRLPQLGFSVSATTRPKRKNEIDGQDYFFLDVTTFKEKIEKDEFAEWEEVYPGLFYGTLRSEIEKKLDEGGSILFDIDVVGGLSLKKIFGDKALAIFISPPNLEVLHKRLEQRGTESEGSLRKRIEKSDHEMNFAGEFDLVLVNDNLEAAIDEAEKLIQDFID